MNVVRFILSFLLVTGTCENFAQDSIPQTRYQVAIFTPLFLDSAFDDISTYKYGKNFPKFFNPGLEFYEGCMMAIDSLDIEGVPLDITVYDTRAKNTPLQNTLDTPPFDETDLIIGHVNATEARLLASHAAKKNIPFINATYPNDAGISNNPNYIILNSTLTTHFNSIYKYIQKNHALNSVVMFRRKGKQEDRIEEYFKDIGKNTNSVPLKIKFVTLSDNFSPDEVKKHLNKDGTTVCIAGSFDITFGEILAQQLSLINAEAPAVLFGMPNWWDVTDFSGSDYKGVEIIFTTPFYLPPNDPLVTKVQNNFKTEFYSRPTDMVYRGFETLYHFAHLLHLNGSNFGSALSEKKYKLFNDFDIQPVINQKTNTLDYFENKKIYFIKKIDGMVTAVY